MCGRKTQTQRVRSRQRDTGERNTDKRTDSVRKTQLTHETHILLNCSIFFLGIILTMKSLSNLIFKTKSKGIMFDRDFILKTMPKKKKG